MDYDIINGAIDDIVWIVNRYNKTRCYDVSVCERLVIALLGYYLSFGPEIFTKIEVVLDALKIHECNSGEECKKVTKKICPTIKDSDVNTCTLWDYKYMGDNEQLVGAIPNIIYCKGLLNTDVLALIHELSHSLEGVTATVLADTPEIIKIRMGYEVVAYNKKTEQSFGEGRGMTELITITVQNRALKEYLKLDPEQVNNPLIKQFLQSLAEHKDRNVLVKAYPIMSAVFKDLIDNDSFFQMIKKHYYDTEQELLAAEFNSLDKRLDFKRLATYADKLMLASPSETMYYAVPIKSQLDVLNEKTGAKPDKKMIFIL